MDAIIGIMVDVSGSMSDVYRMHDSSDVKVERSHAILTAIINIVKKETTRHDRKESVFTCAFGLQGEGVPPVGDILPLLKFSSRFSLECFQERCPRRHFGDAYEPLLKLVRRKGASHAERWIRDSLTKKEALILEECLRDDRDLTERIFRLIPGTEALTYKSYVDKYSFLPFVGSYIASRYKHGEERAVRNSGAYRKAKEIIKEQLERERVMESKRLRIWQELELNPMPVQRASQILDDLLAIGPDASVETLHEQIRKTLDPIRPYIFGGTPMCKALQEVQKVFRKTSFFSHRKVLFILSDGQSADGDPRDIIRSDDFLSLSVTIVTCYLTVDRLQNPKQLLYKPDDSWGDEDGRRALFDISSSMKNTHTPISYLVDAGWELPLSGESRLFVQANSLDVVDEFCRIVVSQLNQPCDALLDVIEKVPLADYINERRDDFKPADQRPYLTCYAHAIASAFHLAIQRIVGRYDKDYLSFERIRERLIALYGFHGAHTEKVLEVICSEYRLRFRKANEREARKAINERRALVAKFSLYKEPWDKFAAFYPNGKSPEPDGTTQQGEIILEDKTARQKILRKSDLTGRHSVKKRKHAVVLTGCDPHSLRFMNSWGTEYADDGFFRVEDEDVLDDMEFFDIYWEEDDLTPEEREAYKREAVRRSKELAAKYPSLEDLHCICPKCRKKSPVSSFCGNVLNARCPKCCSTFKPTSNDLILALYSKNL